LQSYRIWWTLFVFFAVASVLVIQSRYRRWRRASGRLVDLTGAQRGELSRRLRLEGWRLALMVVSLVTMTGLVFAVVLGAAPATVSLLRVLAVVAVLGVVVLSVRL
jgi:hypothetical protein